MICATGNLRGVCGIYGVIHRDTGRVYVGQSRDMGRRIYRHRSEVKKGAKTHFHWALKKHGESAFDFEVLEECPPDKLTERETFYIRLMDAVKNGFNLASDPSRSRWGVKASAETKAKLSEKFKGRVFSEQHRANLTKGMIGRIQPQSMKDKLRARWLGTKRSAEDRRKIGEGQKKPVIQLTMDGIEIARFPSCIEASVELGVKAGTIRSAANGSSPHAFGFRWKYVNT